MSRIKDFYNNYLAKINAYWLVIIVFLVLTLTLGDSSLYKRYTYDQKIRSLEKEIKHYQKVWIYHHESSLWRKDR